MVLPAFYRQPESTVLLACWRLLGALRAPGLANIALPIDIGNFTDIC
jgi:hypothetical protein